MSDFLRVVVSAFAVSVGALGFDSSFAQDPSAHALPPNSAVPSAFLALNKRADHGNVDAELKLAANYATGRDVVLDQTAATYWYRKAADSGVPAAQVETGFRYSTGLGVTRDSVAAARWYFRAAAEGDTLGLTNLGVCQIFGRGVPKDERQGFLSISRAAERHNSYAQTYLGNLYYFGIGAAADPVRAESLYRQAAKKGNAIAAYNLGTLLSVTPNHRHDFNQATAYLRQSFTGGYSPAGHSLGLLLVNHPEINQAPTEAVEDLRISTEQGNWRSAAALGAMARDGQLQPVNIEMAYFWFRVAADLGGREVEDLLLASWPTVTKQIDPARLKQLLAEASRWAEAHPKKEALSVGDGHSYRYFPSAVVSFSTEEPNTTRDSP